MKTFSSYDEAVPLLLDGAVGVLPTDTVYGLVARAADQKAVARFYALKQRQGNPGPVIAASVEQLLELGLPRPHLEMVKHLWPNPLSIEIPLGNKLSYLHQGTGRQAYRVVADEALRRLLEQTGPLVTSSANLPDQPASANIAEAQAYFGHEVDFYVDGGDFSSRPPSTIVRLHDGKLELIREGALKHADIIEKFSK